MKPSYVMIHHTAISYKKNPDQAKATSDYHKAKWNMKSRLGSYAGYHYEIAKNGRVRQLREDGEISAACYQQNMNSGQCIHICLDGDFDHENPAPEEIYALRDLLKRLCSRYGIEPKNINFHRDFAKKSCPGMLMDKAFIRRLPLEP